MDWTKRNNIIWGSDDGPTGNDIKSFETMDPTTLRELVELGFADPDDTQNYSPSIAEFLELSEIFPGMEFIGYAVSPDRADCRVSVEGFRAPFSYGLVNRTHGADEFDVSADEIRAWWD